MPNLLVDVWKYLLRDVVALEGEPGEGEERDDEDENLDDLQEMKENWLKSS